MSKNNRLKTTVTGDDDFAEPNKSNFDWLKWNIIQAKRRREGRFNIDYVESYDLAEEIAGQLPPGVKLQDPNGGRGIVFWLILAMALVLTATLLFS